MPLGIEWDLESLGGRVFLDLKACATLASGNSWLIHGSGFKRPAAMSLMVTSYTLSQPRVCQANSVYSIVLGR